MVEIGRLPVVELVDQRDKLMFLLGRALEKEEHVLDGEALRDRAAIVHVVRLRASVARERQQIALINGPRDAIRNGGNRRLLGKGRQSQSGERHSKHGDKQKWADAAGGFYRLSSEKQSVQCPPWVRNTNTVPT